MLRQTAAHLCFYSLLKTQISPVTISGSYQSLSTTLKVFAKWYWSLVIWSPVGQKSQCSKMQVVLILTWEIAAAWAVIGHVLYFITFSDTLGTYQDHDAITDTNKTLMFQNTKENISKSWKPWIHLLFLAEVFHGILQNIQLSKYTLQWAKGSCFVMWNHLSQLFLGTKDTASSM